MRRIVINDSRISCDGPNITVEFSITKDNEDNKKSYILGYGLEAEYKEYICSEVADGIIATILPFAIRGGYDIVSKIPLTETFYYRVTKQLIPQLSCATGYGTINIVGDVVNPDWHPYAVATAMSLGVDSFATLFEYTGEGINKNYELTHLTFFQSGAHHSGHVGHSPHEEAVFNAQLKRVKNYCSANQRKLISITSNLDEFLSQCFWEDSFDITHTYRNAGFALILQKLLKIYYVSPGHNCDEFSVSLESDCASYERLILPNISNDYITFYNSNGSMSRIDKIKYISKFPETYDNLLVCYAGGDNCGRCYKCKRTLLELYFTGLLHLYKNSFDIERFKKNKKKDMIWFLSKRKSDSMMRQLYEYTKNNKIHIPLPYIILGDLRRMLVSVYKLSRRIEQ